MIYITKTTKNEINENPQYTKGCQIISNRTKKNCNPKYQNTKINQNKAETKPIINKRVVSQAYKYAYKNAKENWSLLYEALVKDKKHEIMRNKYVTIQAKIEKNNTDKVYHNKEQRHNNKNPKGGV